MSSPLDVCIVGYSRTPIGSFRGALASQTAVQLGSAAIRGAVASCGTLRPAAVEEVFLGHVLSAGCGQAPARQAALLAGLSESVPCTSVNKVCSSGLKAVVCGALAIHAGLRDVVVVGGMESMSNAPYLAAKRGGAAAVHSVQRDGLTDSCGGSLLAPGSAMGLAAELCCDERGIDREAMDAHAAESYRRSWAATRAGAFRREIAPYTVPYPSTCSGGDAVVVTGDEEVSRRGEDMTLEELRKLRPAFVKGDGDGGEGKKKEHGRVTAGSSSTLSDGAAALVLASRRYATDNNLPIRGVLRGVGDAAQASERFTTAPALAAPAALRHAHRSSADVDLWEINEAFSVVALANTGAAALCVCVCVCVCVYGRVRVCVCVYVCMCVGSGASSD